MYIYIYLFIYLYIYIYIYIYIFALPEKMFINLPTFLMAVKCPILPRLNSEKHTIKELIWLFSGKTEELKNNKFRYSFFFFVSF